MGEEDTSLEARLTKIESKIDKLTDLITQTQLQEYRLSVVEQSLLKLEKLQERVIALERKDGDKALKWFYVIGAGIITIMLGYIAVKVGLK